MGVLPSVHRAASYGYVHTVRAATAAAIGSWASTAGVPLVDLAEVVGPHVLGGHGNLDGIHWGWAGHAAVGEAMTRVLAQLFEPGTVRAAT